MVKSTNDNQIISFVLELKVEKWKDFDLKEDNLTKVLFCEKRLNIDFRNIGFEFEKLSDMKFEVRCDKQTEIIQKIGTYFFDIVNMNYEYNYNELFIQLYFKISENTETITQKYEESLKEIVTENLEGEYLLFSCDNQSRPSGPIKIISVSIK